METNIMKIIIDNIGHIEHADIDVNSITVIAGNNNTGKSTVGKVLYSIATGLNLLEPLKVLEEKAEAIAIRMSMLSRMIELHEREEGLLFNIRRYCLTGQYLEELRGFYNLDFGEYLPKTIINHIDNKFSTEMGEKINEVFNGILNYIPKNKQEVIFAFRKEIDILLNKSIDDNNFKINIMQKVFNMEFFKQISHLNYEDKESRIKVKELNQKEIKISIKNHRIQQEYSDINTERLFSKAIYIDNPFILDGIDSRYGRIRNEYAHHNVLKNLLRFSDNIFEQNLFNLDHREQIIDKLFQQVMNHGVISRNENGIYFKNKHLSTPLNFSNLSTGLKSFSILYILLKSKNLDQCEYIILDEPEIHLHPEWQLKFAELMVLISKMFNLKLIITSHSPYFIEAIELYSKRNNYFTDIKFYRTKNLASTGRFIIEDVTEDLKSLYEDLAEAFFNLEELRDEIDE